MTNWICGTLEPQILQRIRRMPTSNMLHATTDPDPLTRLRKILDSSARYRPL